MSDKVCHLTNFDAEHGLDQKVIFLSFGPYGKFRNFLKEITV